MTDVADTTRERILAAARREFAAGRTPSLAEVAAAAGVSRATVHRIIGSRAELLALVGAGSDQDTAGRVLAAAAEVVGEAGLAGATMEEIADRADVSRATVYRLFPGKPALLRGLIRTYSPMLPVVDTVDAMADRPPEEVVPAVALAAYGALSARPGVIRTVLLEMATADAETEAAVRESVGAARAALGGYLERQMEAGRLRRVEPLLAVELLAGPVLVHVLLRPRLGLADADPRAAVLEIAGHWLRAMTTT